jgi:hypothetical protein
MATHQTRRTQAPDAVVVLAQPERDDRNMYAEYLSHMGLRPVCVQHAQDAIRIAPSTTLLSPTCRTSGSNISYLY